MRSPGGDALGVAQRAIADHVVQFHPGDRREERSGTGGQDERVIAVLGPGDVGDPPAVHIDGDRAGVQAHVDTGVGVPPRWAQREPLG